MNGSDGLPVRGVVFWPVGTGDSTTVVIDDEVVMQVDLHDLAKADDATTAEIAVVDELVAALPLVDGEPYLATFVLTHADKDHCLGFADLLTQVHIGELWSTPRLWREYNDPDAPELCSDAVAFREESERRINATLTAVGAGGAPASGDRIRVVGFDDEHSAHAYDELPDEYLAWPGQALTVLDGHDMAGVFEAFIHAPFKDDAAAARNETSLSMQVTLTDPATGTDGKVLLFGDLAYDTIKKILDYSEFHHRERYLEWDVLLAPHHCSKRVMYVPGDNGQEVLKLDVLNALERHARSHTGVVVCSSATIPVVDVPGHNPPHRMARDRYADIADEVICTMSWPDETRPMPVIFGVDADGARVVRAEVVKAAPFEAAAEMAASATGRRLAAVTAAAVAVAKSLALPASAEPVTTGPERVAAAVTADRGGASAPEIPVGFGRWTI